MDDLTSQVTEKIEIKIKKILLPIDGSAASLKAQDTQSRSQNKRRRKLYVSMQSLTSIIRLSLATSRLLRKASILKVRGLQRSGFLT